MDTATASFPSLHEQLDRIERLRETQPAQTPRERLQSVCQKVYGEAVPEGWLDEALQENRPTTLPSVALSSASRPVCPPSPEDCSRRSLLYWAAQSYTRPATRQEWKTRQATLAKLVSKWNTVDSCCITGFVMGGVGSIISGLGCLFADAPMVVKLPWLLGTLTLTAVSIIVGTKHDPYTGACRKLLRAYKKAKLDEEQWQEWSELAAVAPLLLELLDSELPLLRGDVRHLRRVAKKEGRQTKRRKLLDSVAHLRRGRPIVEVGRTTAFQEDWEGDES
jgi:hypothetical protein